jgi:hypothetical protein
MAGCGGVSDKTYTALEKQREEVLVWARELAPVATTTLGAPPENASESYDGVSRSGLSDDFTSFKYDVQADFVTEIQDPLNALSGQLGEYDPTVAGNTLRLTNGDLKATFQTYPKGPSKVGFLVEGTPIEIDYKDIRDWEGFVIGEPVDLK